MFARALCETYSSPDRQSELLTAVEILAVMLPPSSERLVRASYLERVAMSLAALGRPYAGKQAGARAGAGAFQHEQMGMPLDQHASLLYAEPHAQAVAFQHEKMKRLSHWVEAMGMPLTELLAWGVSVQREAVGMPSH